MNIHLIIGASGQVGQHLVNTLKGAAYDVIGTYYTHPVPGMEPLDIRSRIDGQSLILKVRPVVVYLPASLTNVDYCELHPEEGYSSNVIGVYNIVNAVNAIKAKLIYFSSDYIFAGNAGPYCEEDPANPICEYGRQKLMAEHYIALHAYSYLIVRTTVVYGWEFLGKNFVCGLLDTLSKGRVLKAPVDQIGSPTYAPNLAQAVVELATSDAQGIFHVAGPDRISRFEFACEAATIFGLDSRLIKAVGTRELRQIAPRPLNAGMVVEKAANKLSIPLMGYRDGLKAMAKEKGLET